MTLDIHTTRDTPLHWSGPEPTIHELQTLLTHMVATGQATPDTPIRIVSEGMFAGFTSYRMQRLYQDRQASLVFNYDEL